MFVKAQFNKELSVLNTVNEHYIWKCFPVKSMYSAKNIEAHIYLVSCTAYEIKDVNML